MADLLSAPHPPHPEESAPSSYPGVECVPDWRRYPWLRAGFSTRQGGGSSVYGEGEQNLGWTAEDDPEIVARNRQGFLREVAGGDMPLISLHQVHSGSILVVEDQVEPMMTSEGRATLQGDGLLTGTQGLLLGVSTADCVPVLIADTRTRGVGAFHAGWRGTLARIVEDGVRRMTARFGSRPEDLIAAIGPAIGPCCFVVGEEVRSGFSEEFSYAASLVRELPNAADLASTGPQFYMNLTEANRRQLLEAGLAPEAITLISECTACTAARSGGRKYFSHRAERGVTGRMLSVIGVAIV